MLNGEQARLRLSEGTRAFVSGAAVSLSCRVRGRVPGRRGGCGRAW